MTRKHRDGSQSNYHCLLSAALVHPNQAPVFPLDHEPIIRADGSTKNDCERNAARRLLEHFEATYSDLKTIFVMDALYACGPLIERLAKVDRWRYVIGCKEDGNAHLFSQFDQRDEAGKMKWIDIVDDQGQEWELAYTNGQELNASWPDTKVNMI